MNQREKEEYLREYAILKAQGKPFFPYAVAKDAAMACVVMAVIITMSLVLGAELGSKANPTTTTYVPRPEWYFFFLFEVLRVIKPPGLVRLATIGMPTLCMILLFLLPFYDRGPERRPERRPVATITGIAVICAMALPDLRGRQRRLADGDRNADAGADRRRRAERCSANTKRARRRSRRPAAWPATRSARTATPGPGPNLTKIGDRLPRQAIARTLVNPTAPMPSFKNLPPKKFNADRRLPLAARSSAPMASRPRAGAGTLEAGQVRAMFDRIAGDLRPDEHGDDRRAAPSLARARRGPRARRARRPRARRGDRDGRPGDRARGARVAGRRGARQRLLRGRCSTAPARRRRGARSRWRLRFEWADAMALPYEDGVFDAATVGFGARNFEDLGRGLRGDGARRAPGRAGRRARDHDADAPAAVALLQALVRPPRARAGRGGRRAARRRRAKLRRGEAPAWGSPTPTPTCRTRSSASRTRAALAGELVRAGLVEVEYLLHAGGIVAIHAGTVPGAPA